MQPMPWRKMHACLRPRGSFSAVSCCGIIVLVQLVILAVIPISADVAMLLINCIYLVRIAGLLRFDADDYAYVAPDKAGVVRTAI